MHILCPLLVEAPRSEGQDHTQGEQHDDEEAPSSEGDGKGGSPPQPPSPPPHYDGEIEREDPVWDAAGRVTTF